MSTTEEPNQRKTEYKNDDIEFALSVLREKTTIAIQSSWAEVERLKQEAADLDKRQKQLEGELEDLNAIKSERLHDFHAEDEEADNNLDGSKDNEVESANGFFNLLQRSFSQRSQRDKKKTERMSSAKSINKSVRESPMETIQNSIDLVQSIPLDSLDQSQLPTIPNPKKGVHRMTELLDESLSLSMGESCFFHEVINDHIDKDPVRPHLSKSLSVKFRYDGTQQATAIELKLRSKEEALAAVETINNEHEENIEDIQKHIDELNEGYEQEQQRLSFDCVNLEKEISEFDAKAAAMEFECQELETQLHLSKEHRTLLMKELSQLNQKVSRREAQDANDIRSLERNLAEANEKNATYEAQANEVKHQTDETLSMLVEDLNCYLPDDDDTKTQLIQEFMTEFESLRDMQEHFAEENARKINYRLEIEDALSVIVQVQERADEYFDSMKDIYERIQTSYKNINENSEIATLSEDGIIPLNKAQERIQRYLSIPPSKTCHETIMNCFEKAIHALHDVLQKLSLAENELRKNLTTIDNYLDDDAKHKEQTTHDLVQARQTINQARHVLFELVEDIISQLSVLEMEESFSYQLESMHKNKTKQDKIIDDIDVELELQSSRISSLKRHAYKNEQMVKAFQGEYDRLEEFTKQGFQAHMKTMEKICSGIMDVSALISEKDEVIASLKKSIEERKVQEDDLKKDLERLKLEAKKKIRSIPQDMSDVHPFLKI